MRDVKSRASSPDGVVSCLRLPAALSDRVRSHARQEYPDECCGVLLGRREAGLASVVEVRPAANISSSDRSRHFEMSPHDLLNALREARARSLDLLGFYHSHPQGGPEPSRGDLEGGWPGTSAVVVPVSARGCGFLRSYRGGAAEEILEEVQ